MVKETLKVDPFPLAAAVYFADFIISLTVALIINRVFFLSAVRLHEHSGSGPGDILNSFEFCFSMCTSVKFKLLQVAQIVYF